MKRLRFVLALARREARGSGRSLGLLLAAVAVGIASLVAIRSFGDAALRAVRSEARSLLGADLVAGSAAPFTEDAERRLAVLLREAGPHRLARVTSFGAMAVAPDGATRLVQVLAVDEGYPLYGSIATAPAGAWGALTGARQALVDPALLAALSLAPGQDLALGDARFRIAGVVERFPGDIGVRSAFGPRVFIPRRHVEETGLVGAGARVRYEAFIALPGGVPAPLLLRHRAPLAAQRVNLRTVDEDQQRLGDGLLRLTRFLGLVGLVALLLGGLGVASAVRVLLQRRADGIAILRSLGATAADVTAVYVVQALGLGLVGGLLGALAGLALAAALPRVAGDLLPVPVGGTWSWSGLAWGLGIGASSAPLFALPSLVGLRRVSPLRALRREVEATPARRDAWDAAALALPAAGILLLASLQAGGLVLGASFALGLGACLGILALLAASLRRFARRTLLPALPWAWRQGLAALHRPANQTRAVVVSLGFGVFLLGTLLVLEANLLRELRVDAGGRRPNLALFDIQPGQLAGVESLVREAGAEPGPATPIVPMRIAGIEGRPVAERLGRLGPDGRPAANAWALRREYRSSYRDELGPAETLAAGAHWSPGEWTAEREGPVPVSLDAGLAQDLGVEVGDEIAWDVQGVEVRSRVASLRRIRWARFEPNFFAVFPDGPLRRAPQTFVRLVRLEDGAARSRLERRVVAAYANVSVLDLADVEQSLAALVGRLAWAVRFMALFSGAVGGLVLLGSVAASQRQRLREAVLLKTLGATRSQVRRVVLAEYACLGTLAALAGTALAVLAGSGLLHFVFEAEARAPVAPLLALAAAAVLATAGTGALLGRSVFRHTSLDLLRGE